MSASPGTFIKLVKDPLRFPVFLFFKLPAAFFAGVRVKQISQAEAIVTVPYKWFSKNPFRSVYFACLAMAAEMSTGLLAMAHLYKQVPVVSMLVIKMEAEYFKKATGLTRFICTGGEVLKAAIEKAIDSKEPQVVTVHSTGTNDRGETVAEFAITWSFKVKAKST